MNQSLKERQKQTGLLEDILKEERKQTKIIKGWHNDDLVHHNEENVLLKKNLKGRRKEECPSLKR
jgi:hypothetical protein